jgi:hypothetical protein
MNYQLNSEHEISDTEAVAISNIISHMADKLYINKEEIEGSDGEFSCNKIGEGKYQFSYNNSEIRGIVTALIGILREYRNS